MSDVLVPAERPGEWSTLGDHERRIRALEALQPCCDDSGGAFETYADCILANPALVAFWPCQEASGDLIEVVGDLSGVDGVVEFADVSGTTYPIYQQPGPFGSGDFAVEFAGVAGTLPADDDRFDFNGTPIFDIIENDLPFTIDLLFYRTVAQAGRLYEYWGGTIGQGVFIDIDSSGFVSFLRTNGFVTAVTAPALGAWTHLRVSHDGTNITIYINGVESATNTSSTTTLTNNGTQAIGNNRNTGGTGWTPFNGRIAYLSLYSAAVTEFCEVITPDGPISSTDADEFMVLTADGSGGTYWAFPTVEVLEDGV